MKLTATTVGATVAGAADSTAAEGSTIGVEAGSEGAAGIEAVEADSETGEVVAGAVASAIEEGAVVEEGSATEEAVVDSIAAVGTAGEGEVEIGAAAVIAIRGVETEEDSTAEVVSMTEKALVEEITLKIRKQYLIKVRIFYKAYENGVLIILIYQFKLGTFM